MEEVLLIDIEEVEIEKSICASDGSIGSTITNPSANNNNNPTVPTPNIHIPQTQTATTAKNITIAITTNTTTQINIINPYQLQ